MASATPMSTKSHVIAEHLLSAAMRQ